LFQKRFFTCLKNIQKILSPFLCKKTIKECPVPLDISIKSNRKQHKTVLYSKSNKNMVGRLFGQFFVVFGQFFNKNIWSPCFYFSFIYSLPSPSHPPSTRPLQGKKSPPPLFPPPFLGARIFSIILDLITTLSITTLSMSFECLYAE
jgi:hypothetical protein